jgi:hypothetical protein
MTRFFLRQPAATMDRLRQRMDILILKTWSCMIFWRITSPDISVSGLPGGQTGRGRRTI